MSIHRVCVIHYKKQNKGNKVTEWLQKAEPAIAGQVLRNKVIFKDCPKQRTLSKLTMNSGWRASLRATGHSRETAPHICKAMTRQIKNLSKISVIALFQNVPAACDKLD